MCNFFTIPDTSLNSPRNCFGYRFTFWYYYPELTVSGAL